MILFILLLTVMQGRRGDLIYIALDSDAWVEEVILFILL